MGTLTRNTDPHQKWARSHPPAMGPTAIPIPVVPDQMPMARARSRSPVKTLVRIDSVDGMIAAPPMPMKAREAMSQSGERANAERAEPVANTIRPARNTRLRPMWSPTLPRTSRSPANTTA
jgi:hypothetical protein